MVESSKPFWTLSADSGWIPFVDATLEGIYKILLVCCIWHLAYHIALGEVKAESSFGLPEVIKIAGFWRRQRSYPTTSRSGKSKNDQTPPSGSASNQARGEM